MCGLWSCGVSCCCCCCWTGSCFGGGRVGGGGGREGAGRGGRKSCWLQMMQDSLTCNPDHRNMTATVISTGNGQSDKPSMLAGRSRWWTIDTHVEKVGVGWGWVSGWGWGLVGKFRLITSFNLLSH